MANVNIITYPGIIREAVYDAIAFDATVGASGILYGCSIEKYNESKIRISPGFGIIKGRLFNISNSVLLDVSASSDSSAVYGQILLTLNLSTNEDPITLSVTESSNYASDVSSLTHTTNEDINYIGGASHQVQLATFKASTSGLVSVTQVMGGTTLINTDYLQELINFKTDSMWQYSNPSSWSGSWRMLGTPRIIQNSYIAFVQISGQAKASIATGSKLFYTGLTGGYALANRGLRLSSNSGGEQTVAVGLKSDGWIYVTNSGPINDGYGCDTTFIIVKDPSTGVPIF